jgi:hypothetical protein
LKVTEAAKLLTRQRVPRSRNRRNRPSSTMAKSGSRPLSTRGALYSATNRATPIFQRQYPKGPMRDRCLLGLHLLGGKSVDGFPSLMGDIAKCIRTHLPTTHSCGGRARSLNVLLVGDGATKSSSNFSCDSRSLACWASSRIRSTRAALSQQNGWHSGQLGFVVARCVSCGAD